MFKLFAFCLDSCIVNKGEKFVHDLDTWEHLEGVPIWFGNFLSSLVQGRSHGAV
jgi:hypothetical protein